MAEKSRDPQRFDPWAGNGYGGMRWFAVSTLIHVGLLVAFATVTLTVIRQVEQVQVSVVDDGAIPEDMFEGEASLDDLAGVLKMEKAAPQQAAPSGPVVKNIRAPILPRPNIGTVGPKIGANPDLPAVSAAGGAAFGAGGIGGLGGSFDSYVTGLRKVGLDVVLVIDATSSMQFVIDDVRARLSELVGTLQRLVPTARVGIVVYRDQEDEYVTKWTDLSFHTGKLQTFLGNITAAGGGDFEEAVRDALDAAVNDLTWRKKSKRVIILVGGSPPHAWDVDEVHQIASNFKGDRGQINTIDVTRQAHYRHDLGMWRAIHGSKTYEPSPLPDFYKETAGSFREIAKRGGGEMVLLDENKQLVRNILELTFGSRWKTEMKQHLEDLS
jgi:hypothetical protein